jgi:hypothetical protein
MYTREVPFDVGGRLRSPGVAAGHVVVIDDREPRAARRRRIQI